MKNNHVPWMNGPDDLLNMVLEPRLYNSDS